MDGILNTAIYLIIFTYFSWLGWGGCIEEVDNMTAEIMSVSLIG